MEEFETKGPEEDQVEHKALHEKDMFVTRIAVLTAVLATIGALFGYNGGKTLTDATLLKNESAIVKTEAADQWAYYQAKSTKQAIIEGALVNASTEEAKKEFNNKIKKYEHEKEEIKVNAEKLEEKSKALNEESEHVIHEHHRWAEAMMMIQIAISLAAITILTKKRWMFWTAGGVSIVGIILGIMSFLSL